MDEGPPAPNGCKSPGGVGQAADFRIDIRVTHARRRHPTNLIACSVIQQGHL